ncbi:hypothetical protein QCA50_011836 [Cerrena zonata]|uniref:F-box domain-containing protein n=1 Tax=Cerrena zonata TaxID=2478898 RepID=A0AAW0FVT1_9APHY
MRLTDPFLPLELVEHIAGFLWGGFPTLKTWASTCRSWHAITLPTIYRSVIIDNELSLRSLERALVARPHIAPWIRELRITVDPHGSTTTTSWEGGPRNLPWIYDLPKKLPRHLTRLHEIHFSKIIKRRWAYDEWMFFPSFRRFGTVKSLVFTHCVFPEDVVDSLVHSLSQLKDLQFRDLAFAGTSFVGAEIAPPKYKQPQLNSFTLHSEQIFMPYPASSVVLKWTLPMQTAWNLRSLHLFVGYPSDVPEVGRIIRAFSSSLQDLSIKFAQSELWGKAKDRGHGHGSSVVFEFLDLSPNIEIRILDLHNPLFSSVTWLLSRIRSPHLHTIQFTSIFNSSRSIKVNDFEPLDEVLHQPNLASINEVRFNHKGSLASSIVQQKLKKCLPATYGRGIRIKVY